MDPGRGGDGRLEQGLGDSVGGHDPIMTRQDWPQRMKDADGARLPRTLRLARTQDAGRAHQRERGEATRDQPLLHLTFDPPIEGPGLWIGSDRGVKGETLRAVLVQELR